MRQAKRAGVEVRAAARAPDCGAVVLPPTPPRRGTFSLLVPEDLVWEVTRSGGFVRLDFRPMTRVEKCLAYRERMQAESGEKGSS